MSVLHDQELDRIAREGAIEPYDPKYLQPASIDCTLGTVFRRVASYKHSAIDLANVPLDLYETEIHEDDLSFSGGVFWLNPGEFALGRTAETIRVPTTMVARMEGKSSLGRLGLIVHVTAGFFDPGFEGFGTCEFVNLLQVPIGLRPGLPICQFSFQLLTGEAQPYSGRYTDGNDAAGSRYGHDEFVGPKRDITDALRSDEALNAFGVRMPPKPFDIEPIT